VRGPAGAPAVRRGLAIGHGAVLRAVERNTVRLSIPVLGELRSSPETLAWLGGVATLAALGIVEWPVAVAIGAGHLLAQQQHLRLLHAFGEALEEA
jgi:hypothetical protein